LISRIILAQIIFGVIFPVAGFFIDEKALSDKLMIFQILSVELFLTLFVTLIDVVTIVVIFIHWQKETFKPKKSKKSQLMTMIKKGESKNIEFKETLRWDTKVNKTNRDLEKVVAKTICGFMNALGGNLIIGVTDKKEVVGISYDYLTLPKKNSDGFQNHLIQMLKHSIGVNFLQFIDVGFEKIGEKEICHIKIKKSDRPVFVKWNGTDDFYVRNGNTTNPLGIKEAISYIDSNWRPIEDTKNKTFLQRLF
jgi:hypothetical protein